jgi:hypothetical protein
MGRTLWGLAMEVTGKSSGDADSRRRPEGRSSVDSRGYRDEQYKYDKAQIDEFVVVWM